MGQPIPQPTVTGTAAELTDFRPAKGQLTHETDTGVFKVGDGVGRHADLPTPPSGTSGAGSPVVRAFPFAYNTPSLLTGHAVYTPTIGDVLLDAWVEVRTAWNGTTPLCDFGRFAGGRGWNAYDGFHGVRAMDQADDSNGLVGMSVNGGPGDGRSLLAAVNADPSGTWGTDRNLPASFITADPIKVVVSQDGTDAGADPGSTQGAAVLYLITATPA
jgi:hypothetical protein